MSSRFYVSRHRVWPGVCEVPDATPDVYLHHSQWPDRSSRVCPFHGSVLQDHIGPTGGWIPMPDEDLVMDEGL